MLITFTVPHKINQLTLKTELIILYSLACFVGTFQKSLFNIHSVDGRDKSISYNTPDYSKGRRRYISETRIVELKLKGKHL